MAPVASVVRASAMAAGSGYEPLRAFAFNFCGMRVLLCSRETFESTQRASIRIAIEKHQPDGTHNDLQIESQGPVAQILEVVFDPCLHLLDGVSLPPVTVDLRPAGDARLHLVTNHVRLDQATVFLIVSDRMRPRPDDAHPALQHIEKLWQFVQRGAANEGAEGGDARVALRGLTHHGAIVLRAHGAELVDDDLVAVEAVAALPEDHRPG